eukprot:SAG31_NODE_46032_length_256_cov_0.662420_1_plen_36_part_10
MMGASARGPRRAAAARGIAYDTRGGPQDAAAGRAAD